MLTNKRKRRRIHKMTDSMNFNVYDFDLINCHVKLMKHKLHEHQKQSHMKMLCYVLRILSLDFFSFLFEIRHNTFQDGGYIFKSLDHIYLLLKTWNKKGKKKRLILWHIFNQIIFFGEMLITLQFQPYPPSYEHCFSIL